MESYTLPFVNGGQPFTFERSGLTPAGYRNAVVAKNHAFVEATRGLSRDAPPEVSEAVLADARQVAQVAQMNSLVYGGLCAVDPKVKERSLEDVIAAIPMPTYLRLVKGLTATMKRDQGEAKAAAPLADPKAK